MSRDLCEIEIIVRSELRHKPSMHDPDRLEREALAQLRLEAGQTAVFAVFQEALAALSGATLARPSKGDT